MYVSLAMTTVPTGLNGSYVPILYWLEENSYLLPRQGLQPEGPAAGWARSQPCSSPGSAGPCSPGSAQLGPMQA